MSASSLDINSLFRNSFQELQKEFFRTRSLDDRSLTDYLTRFSNYDAILNKPERRSASFSELADLKMLPKCLTNLRLVDFSTKVPDRDLEVLFSRAIFLQQIILRDNQEREFHWLETCTLAHLVVFKIPNSPLFETKHLVSVLSMTNHLRLLNISGCKKVDRAALPLIALSCPTLEFLDISDTTIDLDDALTRMAAIKSLRFFVIANCQPFSMAGMIEMSADFPSLIYFNAAGVNLENTVIEAFANLYQKSIIQIDLSGCKTISDAGLTTIAMTCKSLKALKVTGCDSITRASIEAIKTERPHLKITSSHQ